MSEKRNPSVFNNDGRYSQLVSWLKETDCEMAAMESTGSYWKPVYNIFEEEQIPIMVVNAQHIKGVPGRKTDVKMQSGLPMRYAMD